MAVIREGGPNPRRPINPTPPSTRPQPKKIPRFADGTGSTLPTDRIQQSGDAFMLGSPRPGMTTAAPTGTPDPTFKPPVQYSPPTGLTGPATPRGGTQQPRGPQPNDMARQNANPNAAFNRQGAMPAQAQGQPQRPAMPTQAQAPQRRPINPTPPSARPMGRRQPMTASQMMQLRRPTMPTRPGTPPPQMRQGQMPTQISQLLQGLRRPDQV